MQDTPLYTALLQLAQENTLRFHMPGHKGKSLLDHFPYAIDYTETHGTGNLYEGEEPIRGAELRAAEYYQAGDCHFLTGGSTQGVQAMLCAAAGEQGSILLDRNCHKSALSACALFDLTPEFICPPIQHPFSFTGKLTRTMVRQALQAHPQVCALLTVSPNYYGVSQDIAMLAEECHAQGKLLLVDAAHGAHFPACGLPSPIAQGADAAVLSAHKTLPALGQGAYLIFTQRMDGHALRRAEAMIGTSSPSYPIMAALDYARAWLKGAGQQAYQATMQQAAQLRQAINETAVLRAYIPATQDDACRLTVDCTAAGMTGHALDELLYSQYHIACEMADTCNVVCILTGADSTQDIQALQNALLEIAAQHTKSKPIKLQTPAFPLPKRVMSVRKAWFAACHAVKLSDAAGHICARAVTPYPPGIPILWPGEKIENSHIEILHKICYTKHTEIMVISDMSQHVLEGGF